MASKELTDLYEMMVSTFKKIILNQKFSRTIEIIVLRTICVLYLIFVCDTIYSQNLVEDLEECNKVNTLSGWTDSVKGHCKNWYSLNEYGHYSSNLCTCDYEYSESELDYTLNLNTCVTSIVDSHYSDCNVVHLNFGSHVNDDPFSEIKNSFWSNYLIHEFNNPLPYNKEYHISYDIYIDSSYDSIETVRDQIGMSFTYSKPKASGPKYALTTPFIKLDTIIFDKWYTQSMNINPLCDINYLTFGVFATEFWPNYYSPGHFSFYISNVHMEDSIISDEEPSVIFDCLKSEAEAPYSQLDTIIFYYQSNEYGLNKSQIRDLERVVRVAKKENRIININSFTDDVGSNNMVLSTKRAQFIKEKLIKDYKLNGLQVKAEAKGQLDIRGEDLEESRKLNRKSIVSLSNYTIDNVYYERALQALEKDDLDAVKSLILKWCYLVRPSNKMFVLVDPRLKEIEDRSFWKKINGVIYQDYKKHDYPKKSFFLDSLGIEDQMFRTMKRNLMNLTFYDSLGYYYGLGHYFENVDSVMEAEHDSSILSEICEFLDEFGYPSISEFGENANRTCFWALAHSGSFETINRYLPTIHESCRQGKSKWLHYATLMDKSMYLQDIPQIYGTQYVSEGNVISYYKFDDIVSVNYRRKLLGLEILPAVVPFYFK